MSGEMLMDRVPPQNIEAEQAVLGAILLDSDALVTAMERVSSDDFYRGSHQRIFEAMIELAQEDEPVDLITLTARLQNKQELEEAGGVTYLSELANAVPTAANVDYYAQIVEEKSMLRRLIRTATQIVSNGYASSEDVGLMLNDAEQRILEISQRRSSSGFVSIRDVLMEVFERVEFLYSHKGGTTGIPSGFHDLDKMTSGFQRSDLIIVAARPSVGKTAFALNIAQNVGVRAKETVAIFSLEMGAAQLVQRMVCAESNVDAQRMRTGFLESDDWEKLTMAIGALSEANIYIDDSPGITVADIRAKCRRLKQEKGLGMILIDYLQLISGRGKGDNRQQEVSEISRTLKQIARELDVPVIALSQLSRGVEQRQDKRPMMSDLRESGSIEQDADIVAFLYRDDYYDKETEKKNIIEIIIAKQRNGPVGTVELAFLKNYNKFVSLDRTHQEAAAGFA
ncbi:replicative DNA helicase [Paenibacillus larvae]|uniref:Replicative DNA helicase n=4 Tax=Paenibacillus larvae TaxID=1464 RepID=V9VZC5_9BACL|nr:replicative DNA helicase [Paenibacillus larvae]AHD04026.1 replicative DNA helicase DnaC [Paenibacillus larvae subsp. larvae DSM 25430]AQR78725.1 replicative DNA helicase [Paenibacillus larvae subsp. larvae]AQT84984.1 replicative DNA helicase [Paenibacillus larvae subsp. pulvifaciens]AQZ46982.1 replicative DNA helicase [Paenibacillus larvae subsp. pulvifaciens]AVF24243.1 replicative DNA helicase DnaC [Paenibacillus larvae subsp. larvae]